MIDVSNKFRSLSPEPWLSLEKETDDSEPCLNLVDRLPAAVKHRHRASIVPGDLAIVSDQSDVDALCVQVAQYCRPSKNQAGCCKQVKRLVKSQDMARVYSGVNAAFGRSWYDYGELHKWTMIFCR